MKAMLIDVEKCIGCYNCVVGCKDEYVDNPYPPYSEAQPPYHYWMNIQEVERGSHPQVKRDHIAVPCMQCNNAPCMAAYPDAVYKRADGIVVIDPEAPMDEGIVDSCPYGAIYWNEDLGIGQKCNFCVQRLAEGEDPKCVSVCPMEAISFGDYEEMAEELDGAEVLHPEYDARPNVYYVGLPKTFVAGNLYDLKNREAVNGATVTAQSLRTGEMWATQTDSYGDFWLEGLNKGDLLVVRFQSPGFFPKMRLVYLNEDKSLGYVSLFK
jgi:Fe-S-cluster-containing dehydrogenase component